MREGGWLGLGDAWEMSAQPSVSRRSEMNAKSTTTIPTVAAAKLGLRRNIAASVRTAPLSDSCHE